MKRTRINPRSKKREAIRDQRAELVRRLLEERPYCEVDTGAMFCGKRSEHIHELLSRARGGSILDEANCLAVCFDHHRLIHDNPEWATEQGLLIHSWDKPSDAPADAPLHPALRPHAQAGTGASESSS